MAIGVARTKHYHDPVWYTNYPFRLNLKQVRDAVQGHIVSQLDVKVKKSDAVIELHDVLHLDTGSDDEQGGAGDGGRNNATET